MTTTLSHRYTAAERKEGAWSADFVQSKGEGQIFLLHGPSGVGKTYTAEYIAEMTGKSPMIQQIKDKLDDTWDRSPSSLLVCG